MGALLNVSIRVDQLPKEKFVKGKPKEVNGKMITPVYCNLTLGINDETRYGNNVSVMDSQTKEEREAKKPKEYFGNGKVIWTDGTIVVAEREVQDVPVQGTEVKATATEDLPF